MVETIQVILTIMYIVGLIFFFWGKRQHEEHLKQILDAMEKERKLYQIISNKVQYDFQKAIREGKIRILPYDDRSNS